MNDSQAHRLGSRGRDALLWGGALLLIFLFLFEALVPGRVLLPLDIVTQQWPPWQQPNQVDEAHNPLLSDVVNYIYPVKEFAAASLKDGLFPMWNPYVLAGYPFTYNTQAGIFYPLFFLYLLLESTTAVDATIIIQMALGSLFMILYLRQLRLHRLAVLGGSILFVLNGLMVVWLEWQVVHAAVIWLPLQLALVERLHAAIWRDEPALAWSALLAAAMAVPWLGGHWNWTIYAGLISGAYLLGRLVGVWRAGQRSGRPVERGKLTLAATIPMLALALCLVQVLPAVVYLSQSHRQDLPLAESLRYGLLNRGVTLLVPRFFGDPVARTWWGFDNFNESTWYVGILPLVLAAVAITQRRDWPARFFTVLLVAGLLLALGTPLYALLHALPVFGGLLPSRAAILVVVALVMLAALSLDTLLTAGPERRAAMRVAWMTLALLPLIVGVYLLIYRQDALAHQDSALPALGWFALWWAGSVVILFLFQRGPAYSAPVAVLALVWLAADLFLFGFGYNPARPVSELYPPDETTAFLTGDAELSRLVTPPEGLAYPPNSSLAVRVPNLSGYEPGILQSLVDYINAAEGDDAVRFERKLQPLNGLDSPLLDALNARHIVTIEDRWGEPAAAAAAAAPVAWQALPAMVRLDMPDAGLFRVDVPLRTIEPVEVTARVLAADSDFEFAHTSLTVDAANGGLSSFFFEAFPAEWGREFRLALDGAAEAGVDASGVLIAAPYYLTRPGLVHEGGKTRVYERPGYLPRVFVVPQALPVASPEAALEAAMANAGRLGELVILETGSDPPPDLGAGSFDPPPVTVESYELNEIRLSVDMPGAGFLVLADSSYPGWRATVNGDDSPIYRANSVVRAVYLAAGPNEVVFAFRPPDFYAGAAVSAAAWLFVAAALGAALARRMRAGRERLAR